MIINDRMREKEKKVKLLYQIWNFQRDWGDTETKSSINRTFPRCFPQELGKLVSQTGTTFETKLRLRQAICKFL